MERGKGMSTNKTQASNPRCTCLWPVCALWKLLWEWLAWLFWMCKTRGGVECSRFMAHYTKQLGNGGWFFSSFLQVTIISTAPTTLWFRNDPLGHLETTKQEVVERCRNTAMYLNDYGAQCLISMAVGPHKSGKERTRKIPQQWNGRLQIRGVVMGSVCV